MHFPDDYGGPKWLTVAQLRRVLAELPDDYTLMVNKVGNRLPENGETPL